MKRRCVLGGKKVINKSEVVKLRKITQRGKGMEAFQGGRTLEGDY